MSTENAFATRTKTNARKRSVVKGKSHAILAFHADSAKNDTWKHFVKVMRIMTGMLPEMSQVKDDTLNGIGETQHDNPNGSGFVYYALPLGQGDINQETGKEWQWIDYVRLLKSFDISAALFYNVNEQGRILGRVSHTGTGSGVTPRRTFSSARNRATFRENAKQFAAWDEATIDNMRNAAYELLKKVNRPSFRLRQDGTTTLTYERAGMFPQTVKTLVTPSHLLAIKQEGIADTLVHKRMENDCVDLQRRFNAIMQACDNGDTTTLALLGIDAIYPDTLDDDTLLAWLSQQINERIVLPLNLMKEKLGYVERSLTVAPEIDVPVTSQSVESHLIDTTGIVNYDLTWHHPEKVKPEWIAEKIIPALGYNRIVDYPTFSGNKRMRPLVRSREIRYYDDNGAGI